VKISLTFTYAVAPAFVPADIAALIAAMAGALSKNNLELPPGSVAVSLITDAEGVVLYSNTPFRRRAEADSAARGRRAQDDGILVTVDFLVRVPLELASALTSLASSASFFADFLEAGLGAAADGTGVNVFPAGVLVVPYS
jgi:hypothetical protein